MFDVPDNEFDHLWEKAREEATNAAVKKTSLLTSFTETKLTKEQCTDNHTDSIQCSKVAQHPELSPAEESKKAKRKEAQRKYHMKNAARLNHNKKKTI